MSKTISAVEANRHFSQVLRSVRDGESYVVTTHGRPVARITPVGAETDIASNARRQLLTRLRRQPVAGARKGTRDELYEP